jgi:hypothetical protein
VTHNPVKGVKRPKVESYEGNTPALGDGQARALLDAPGAETEKGKRDRAILSVLLYHGLRREELCTLKVRDIHARRGVLHLRVHGKGGKVWYLPLHPGTAELVTDYLEAAGHVEDLAGALFRPVKNNTGRTMEGAITADGIYKMMQHYAERVGVNIEGFGAHSLRATAATNALDHEADIAKVQEWLGHANIATTRLYDRRRTRPEDSPTIKAGMEVESVGFDVHLASHLDGGVTLHHWVGKDPRVKMFEVTAGDQAQVCFLEFFASKSTVQPVHVAIWIEAQTRALSLPNLKNSGSLEKATAMANLTSTYTTQLYDCHRDE